MKYKDKAYCRIFEALHAMGIFESELNFLSSKEVPIFEFKDIPGCVIDLTATHSAYVFYEIINRIEIHSYKKGQESLRKEIRDTLRI